MSAIVAAQPGNHLGSIVEGEFVAIPCDGRRMQFDRIVVVARRSINMIDLMRRAAASMASASPISFSSGWPLNEAG